MQLSMIFLSPQMSFTHFAVNINNYTLEKNSFLKIIKSMKMILMLLYSTNANFSNRLTLEVY